MAQKAITLQERVDKAVELADETFWAVITSYFPEIKTGEIPIETHIDCQAAMKQAVKTWIEKNKPEYKV